MSPLCPPIGVTATLCGLAMAAAAPAQELEEAPPFKPPALLSPAKADPSEEASVLANPDGPEVVLAPETEAAVPTELLDLVRRSHPWARFEPGAWRRTQTVSEAFDAEGGFAGRSLTERIERLVAVDRDSYTLSTQASVSLAGLRKPGPVETQHYHLLTDRPYELGPPLVTPAESTTVSLSGLSIPCGSWGVEHAADGGVEIDTLLVSQESTPTLLRRERQAVVVGRPATRSVENVVRLDLPDLYGGAITSVWHVWKRVEQPSGARSEGFSMRSLGAPGGVHVDRVVEYDADGQRIRWAVTQLLEAGREGGESIAIGELGAAPGVEIEVRPRRFLRLLRREERRTPQP